MTDPMLTAAQTMVDHNRPGWTVAHYVTVVGLQRIVGDNDEVETSIARYSPQGQPPYASDGLLDHGTRLAEGIVEDSE